MKIVIFGISEYSSYVYKTLIREGVIGNDVIAFTLTQDHISTNKFCELPVYPFENLNGLIEEPFSILITVGYTKMNKGRETVYKMCKERGFNVYTYISCRAFCDTDVIGEGCLIMPLSYIPADAKIGCCNIINPGAYLSHTGIMGNYNWISPNVSMGGNVKIGNNCFIGLDSVLKNGLNVGDEVFVGANSYLTVNADDGTGFIGIPAENKANSKALIKMV